MTPPAARLLVLAIVLVASAVRFWLASVTGLGIDESYMVGNARDLALGYVDHPPLHVWIAWAAATVFQSEAPIVVRAPFILLFAGSTWLMFRLTGRLFGAAAGVWAVIAFNLAPVFSLADGSWVLPDGPLIFFLLAAANALARILFENDSGAGSRWQWLLAGALGGLALLSKYNALFLFVAVLIYLLATPSRRLLATAGPWLGGLAALVAFSPAILWNFEHGFAGFAFQGGRLGSLAFDPVRFLTAIGGQFAYLTPWLAVPFALSLVSALRRGRGDPRAFFLAILALTPIAFFAVAALSAPGLPHWAMPGWLFAIPLFGRDAVQLAERRPMFARGYMAGSAAAFAVLIAAFAWQATRGGLVPPAVVATNPAVDPTSDLIDWRELREAVDGRGLLAPDLVVASPRWLDAGKAGYVLGRDIPVICLCRDPRQFAFRAPTDAYLGRDALLVAPRHVAGATHGAAAYFERIEPIAPVAITRGGETVILLDLAIGRGLRFP